MLISLSLQLLLLMFEILVCDKLETRRYTWSLTFIPLLFVSLLSISVCVWSVKNGRGFELEFFASINLMQIILIALKLDNFINWSWLVVFIPSWILLCFAVIVIIYAMIFAAIVLRSSGVGIDQRRANIQLASSSSMIFLPLLFFIILLTSKLDSPPNVATPSYFITCAPLLLTFIILIRMSFGVKPGSLWWFGMRTDFCTFLLNICPCLKEYGNTSFVINQRFGNDAVADVHQGDSGSVDYEGQPVSDRTIDSTNERTNENAGKRLLHTLSNVFSRDKAQEYHNNQGTTEPVVPKMSIDTPD